jgi:predicted RND superfamily exporter protein
MAWRASKIELSYNFVQSLPADDPTMIAYQKFKATYGEDGRVMVIGIQDSNFYKIEKFNDWYELTQKIKKTDGIEEVMSIANIYDLKVNDSLKKFEIEPIFNRPPKTQTELDSLKTRIEKLSFYKGLLYNEQTKSYAMMITFTRKDVNSKRRIEIVNTLKEFADAYGQKHKTEIRYSGMPYIRTTYMMIVLKEMKLFLLLAIAVTMIILFMIFKSFRVVGYSMIIVVIGIIWSLGTIELFDYKITILTGLIPSIITVIGLPNCVFIINKYQNELRIHRNKVKAVYHSITKVSLSNFLANVTTSIGFGVFYFTQSSLLVEFGVVSAINVMATYAIALVLVPTVLSFMPMPKRRHTLHLTNNSINKVLDTIDNWVYHRRAVIYISLTIFTVVAVLGMTRIKLIGYMVDDLPKKNPIYTDLRFFEENFHGVLPFEIAIDTREPNGVLADNAKTLYKIHALQKIIAQKSEISKPLSVVEALKFAYQSYKGGKEKFYILPGIGELNKLTEYVDEKSEMKSNFSSLMDTSRRYTRVSFRMKDIGSEKMKILTSELKPRIDSIFPADKYDVQITGGSLVFLKGNDYLFKHLFVALSIAIVLILMLGIALFRSPAIILLSKLPVLVPLFVTAGIMGYGGIDFKPSTIIIFTVAFALSSDGTIYILTEYWNQLRRNPGNPLAISKTIKEVGASMIYTSIILFFGFAIFAASSFGGTASLGILMSITIASSLFTNLVFLPSILLSIENIKEKRRRKKEQNKLA